LTAALARPSALARSAPPDHTDVLETQAHWLRRNPALIVDRLRYLRTHPEGQAAMLAQSYWHANGFAKVRLSERDDVQTRLHVWPEGRDRQGDVDPHAHRWSFASWVAVGQGMTETYFTPAGAGNRAASRYTRCEYGRVPAGEGYLKPTGDAWLRRTITIERRGGDVYTCPLPVVHTVAPWGDDLLATVVVQGPVVKRSAAVYRPSDGSNEVLQDPIPMPDLAKLFERVEAALERTG
jgi:hypothetical protein